MLFREYGQSRCHIDDGNCTRALLDGLGLAGHRLDHTIEGRKLDSQRAVGGVGNPVSRSASSVVVKRIAFAIVWRWMKRAFASVDHQSSTGTLPAVTSMK
jgi:hypothetical protein